MTKKETNKIIEDYEDKLYAYTRKQVNNTEDARDIVQDVFYQLFKTLEDALSPIEHLSGWLFRVTKNIIINKRKKKSEVPFPDWDEEEQGAVYENFSDILWADKNSTPETAYLQQLIWTELQEVLSDLPEEQKEAYILTEIEGYSSKEAAEKMDVSVNTLLSRKHYAMNKLKKRLNYLYTDLSSY